MAKTREPGSYSGVYPRMCGADRVLPLGVTAHMGSPPHLWGGGVVRQVPPRMCGADAACKTLAPRVEGSLPHVRGGFVARLDAVDREWFTPACAGRMPTIFHRDACPKVHPRMCGADFRGLA